ncbi:hypothetical protein CKO15_12380 [Halorhodospira abdelmalekii]|nr:hypothetical protein [Halorhodospira abdelmalekii]
MAAEEGISAPTIYAWRTEARKKGRLMPDQGTYGYEGWSFRYKFNAVLETATLSEEEIAEYCRRRGLYPEHVEQRQRLEQERARLDAEHEQIQREIAAADARAEQARQERIQAEQLAAERDRQIEQLRQERDEARHETAALRRCRHGRSGRGCCGIWRAGSPSSEPNAPW